MNLGFIIGYFVGIYFLAMVLDTSGITDRYFRLRERSEEVYKAYVAFYASSKLGGEDSIMQANERLQNRKLRGRAFFGGYLDESKFTCSKKTTVDWIIYVCNSHSFAAMFMATEWSGGLYNLTYMFSSSIFF